jgi:hypothetical protein
LQAHRKAPDDPKIALPALATGLELSRQGSSDERSSPTLNEIATRLAAHEPTDESRPPEILGEAMRHAAV